MIEKNIKMLGLIWAASKGYRIKLLLLNVFCGFMFFFIPILITPYIFALFGNAYQENILTVRYAVVLSILYAFTYSIAGLFRALFVEKYLWYGGVLKVENTLRKKLFNYVLGHSIRYYDNKMSGVIAEKINKITANFAETFNLFGNIINSFISMIISLIIYSKINYYLTIVFCIWTLLFCIVYYFSSKISFKKRKITSNETAIINGIINDDITNVNNIKSFSTQKNEERKIKKQGNIILRKLSVELKAEAISRLLIGLLNIILMLFISCFSYYLAFNGKIMIGTFIFICQNIILLKSNMETTYEDTKLFIEFSAEMKDGFETLLEKYEIEDNPNSKKLIVNNGKIVFKGVNFKY